MKMKPCVITLQSFGAAATHEDRKVGRVETFPFCQPWGGGFVVKGAVQPGQVTRCPRSGWALISGAGPPSEFSACARHMKINASSHMRASLHEFHMHKAG